MLARRTIGFAGALLLIGLLCLGTWVALEMRNMDFAHSPRQGSASADHEGKPALRGVGGHRQDRKPPHSHLLAADDESAMPPVRHSGGVPSLWEDNAEGAGWIFAEPPRSFDATVLPDLHHWERTVLIEDSEGLLRVALPLDAESPHVRVLAADGGEHPNVTAYAVRSPESGEVQLAVQVDAVPVELHDVHLQARDWRGGLEHLTLVFVGRQHEIRGRVAILSRIASINLYNVGRDRFGVQLAVSRIRGLSSIGLILESSSSALLPTDFTATLIGVIETVDLRGEYKEYRELQSLLGAEEDLANFSLQIDAVFENVDLQARPGVAHIHLTDRLGVAHRAAIRVEYHP